MAWPDRHWPLRRVALGDGPSALTYQPLNKGGDYIGQGLVEPPFDDSSVIVIGLRHGQRDDAGLRAVRWPERFERRVCGLCFRFRGHQRSERPVYHSLQLRRRTEAHGQILERGAARDQPALYALIERH